ncbi:hypothetical protein CJ030_MR4G028703 [Morella rubra]|uniref:Stress-response A/B barrel domain-containing protein n=1 Tax=Morella rubra TaxID=262757 RepID=A0A6A1VSN6_9ROSI|nr:hypothetical protein CJ030_MR4G028703 [Morella rubra]
MEKLVSKLDTIESFEWGKDIGSQEMRRQGFTHAFLVTFQKEEDFTSFLDHPSHFELRVVRYTSSVGSFARDRHELPSPTTTSPIGTQSSCASTSEIKHLRGSTRGIALLKACTRGKLTVHIPNGRTDSGDMASSVLSSHIGALIRQHVPFETSKWKEVLDKVKSCVMNRVLDDFQLDYDRADDRITVTSTRNTAYRTHRNRMFHIT